MPEQKQSLNTDVLCCFHNYLNTEVWPRHIQMIHKNIAILHICAPHGQLRVDFKHEEQTTMPPLMLYTFCT